MNYHNYTMKSENWCKITKKWISEFCFNLSYLIFSPICYKIILILYIYIYIYIFECMFSICICFLFVFFFLNCFCIWFILMIYNPFMYFSYLYWVQFRYYWIYPNYVLNIFNIYNIDILLFHHLIYVLLIYLCSN